MYLPCTYLDFWFTDEVGHYYIAFILSDDNFTSCCFSNYFSVILGLHSEPIYFIKLGKSTHNIFRICLFHFLTVTSNLVDSYDCCSWCVAGSC